MYIDGCEASNVSFAGMGGRQLITHKVDQTMLSLESVDWIAQDVAEILHFLFDLVLSKTEHGRGHEILFGAGPWERYELTFQSSVFQCSNCLTENKKSN